MEPRSLPWLKSTPIIGQPLQRPSPLMGKSHAPGVAVSTWFLLKVLPASAELVNTSPSGPAQTTYTSPLGPTAGMAPMSVLLLSTASPDLSEMRWAGDHDLAPSTEREK